MRVYEQFVRRHWHVVVALAILGGGTLARVASAPSIPAVDLSVSGIEIAVIFVVSSSCGASRTPGFAAAFRSLRDSVEVRAQRKGARMRMIGVSVDPTVRDGLEVLRRFGDFDEMTLGGGWLNLASQQYLWGRFAGKAGVPQVLIFERRIEVQETEFRVAAERFLIRRVGTDEFLAWADAGFPWPR